MEDTCSALDVIRSCRTRLLYVRNADRRFPLPLPCNLGHPLFHTYRRGRPKCRQRHFPTVLLLIFVSIRVGGGLSYGAVALQNRANGPQQPTHVISLTPVATTTPGAQTPTPGTQSPTPGTTGDQLPTPLSFQRGVSPDLGFSIQFPTGWIQDKTQQGTNGNKDIAFHPSTRLLVTLFIAQISAANSAQITSTTDINTSNIQGFGTNSNLPSP